MSSDAAHLRSAAVQLVSLATAVMGFGFSNAFIFEFNVSGGIFNALVGVADLFLGKPVDPPPGVMLDWMRLSLIGLALLLYAIAAVSIGMVFFRDSPGAEHLRNPYLATMGTIFAVGLLFIASIFDRDINQRPSLDIAGFAVLTGPA